MTIVRLFTTRFRFGGLG